MPDRDKEHTDLPPNYQTPYVQLREGQDAESVTIPTSTQANTRTSVNCWMRWRTFWSRRHFRTLRVSSEKERMSITCESLPLLRLKAPEPTWI